MVKRPTDFRGNSSGCQLRGQFPHKLLARYRIPFPRGEDGCDEDLIGQGECLGEAGQQGFKP